MYTSEFPVESQVPTFEPTLLVGIVLVVLAVAVLAYVLGRYRGVSEGKDQWVKVPKTIHDAIKEKCVAAASAPSGELVRKTDQLLDEIEKRIGRVLDFGGRYAEVLKALVKAREGKPRVEEKKAAPAAPGAHDKPGHDDHGHDADGHGHDPAGHDQKPPPAPTNVTILGGHTLVVNPAPSAPPPAHPPHPPHPPAPEEPKPLEHDVYMQELRMAVVKFSDCWHRPECLDELTACQAQLTKTARKETPPSGG